MSAKARANANNTRVAAKADFPSRARSSAGDDRGVQPGGRGRGLSLKALIGIGYGFLIASVIGMVWANLRVDDPSAASLADLSAAILFEVLSWAGLPILTWCFVHQYWAHAGSWAMLGWIAAAALVAEVPYDLAVSQRAFDFSSQNLVWAFVVCFLLAKALETTKSGGLKVLAIVGAVLWLVLLCVGVRFGLVYVGLFVFAFFLVFWFLSARENTMMMTAGLLGASLLVAPALGTVFLHYRSTTIEDDRSSHWGLLWVYPVLMVLAAFSAIA